MIFPGGFNAFGAIGVLGDFIRRKSE